VCGLQLWAMFTVPVPFIADFFIQKCLIFPAQKAVGVLYYSSNCVVREVTTIEGKAKQECHNAVRMIEKRYKLRGKVVVLAASACKLATYSSCEFEKYKQHP